ncbi:MULTISPECIES: amidase [Rhizobium]|uniref:Asp-tRNA(Asn)/Glu-tRNA(Gln) amidotransferase A subunit family amidase n=1 Tax=Rhizobium mongolense TaxID=57676 RepID=A0A7W6RNF0_9HYPH|nr:MULTISPECIES: amidase family protein [Rhizobium]MBB4275694.1 Asp-tRNA(Asn)/Glu-tRNA(Gln) amidotransferase A subunit family amidase [Rhizobium mongolense]ULJ72204.1 amidase [Rhizobium gallicum]
MTRTHPADLTASEASRLIKEKKLSPVEMAKASIERVETLNHAINAVVARNFDRLLDEAKAAEEKVMAGEPLGPLHGLTFGVKDMIDVTGLPTTFGSEIFRDNIATKDDAIVTAMRAAGAMPLGKTNNPDWSAGGNTINRVYGATGNPHDPTKSAAGSSGGSAALLASLMAPLATGSDTGGSLRNPAAFCGVVGFRPSPGVVPGDTRPIGLFHISTSGPMARNVADVGLMLSVLARPDRFDPFTVVVAGKTAWNPGDFADPKPLDLRKPRIAFTEDFGFAPTENVVRDAFRKVVAKIAPHLGMSDELHPASGDADRIFSVLRAIAFVGHRHFLEKEADKVGPNVKANVEEAFTYGVQDVYDAMVAQTAYYRSWQRFYDDWDFILCPAVTISPRDWHELYPTEIDGKPTRSYYHWLAMAYASTLAGHPSITIPVGRDALGMPFGLQIVGRRHDDLGVLRMAAAIEALLADDPELGVPQIDLDRLAASAPIKDMPGFIPDW